MFSSGMEHQEYGEKAYDMEPEIAEDIYITYILMKSILLGSQHINKLFMLSAYLTYLNIRISSETNIRSW